MINKIKIHIPAKVVENFAYVSLLQVFLLFAPLITYPYLVSKLGKDIYGIIVTAQVLVSYFSILIDFGSNSIAARYIALQQNDVNKLSKTLSCVLSARLYLWLISLILYIVLISLIHSFRSSFMIFLLMFGLTMNDLLFPQFFFQGIEQMKHITQINLIIKTLFILLIFLFVKDPLDSILVPVFYSIGYFVGGLVAILIIIKKYGISLSLIAPKDVMFYIRDCSPILAKELISTVKDKLNVFLIGRYIGMRDVVVYDLGFKFVSILSKPITIIGSVLLPRFCKDVNRNKQNITLLISFSIVTFSVLFMNIFLDEIVIFFLHEHVDLFPIRLLLLAPIALSISSCIGYIHMFAKGLNKHILWSILVASITYSICIIYAIFMGYVGSLMTFIFISLLSYCTELIYRLYVYCRIK